MSLAYRLAADAIDPRPRATDWPQVARPEQLPPPGGWMTWLILAGRGWGKTRTHAEWVAAKAIEHPGCRIALVAATISDARDTMVEGESGLLRVLRDDELRGGGRETAWNRSLGELYFANGTRCKTFSSEKPGSLRGPQHHFAWADEIATWKDAKLGAKADPAKDTTWSNLIIGLRLGRSPQVVASTTPRRVALVKSTHRDNPGLTQQETTVVTRGRTTDNLANLAPSYRANVVDPLVGTRLARQELDGEILDDVPGALWTLATLEACRVAAAPDLAQVVVSIDPSGGEGVRNDEQGIAVCGRGVDGKGYVIADRSCKLSPHGWGSRAIAAYHEFGADRIVAESNFGGAMVEATIRSIDPSIRVVLVTASRGKAQRAEPIAALYEREQVHHVGRFDLLEDQLTEWTPDSGTSPDRLDAVVWALSDLMLGPAGPAFFGAV